MITVLDADSELRPNFLANMVKHFQSTNVVAVAANVRIKRALNLIELVQYIKYLVGYQLKSSEQVLNLEYIIGGIGSTFRRTIMEAVNLYDTDTVTEDIDLTMKLLRKFGNTSYKFCYAFDCVYPHQRFIILDNLLGKGIGGNLDGLEHSSNTIN